MADEPCLQVDSTWAAAFLADDILLAVRERDSYVSPVRQLGLPHGRMLLVGDVEWCALEGTDGSRTTDVGMARLATEAPSNPPEVLRPGIGHKGLRCLLPPAAVHDLRTLLREHLAALAAPERNRLTSFLATSTNLARGKRTVDTLLVSLSEVRQALRERLPVSEFRPGAAPGFALDKILRVDPKCFYMRGWLYTPDASDVELVAVSPEGHRVGIAMEMPRHPRPDLRQLYRELDHPFDHGFATLVELPSPSHGESGWVLELRSPDGVAAEAMGPLVTRDVDVAVDLLHEHNIDQPPHDRLRRQVLAPALTRHQEGLLARVEVIDVLQYGAPPDLPSISVVVPLYKRIDFLEHQLAQFANDREFQAVDLIYVLDSPENSAQLAESARRLSFLYDVPFRTLVLNRNSGYAAANNAGVDFAHCHKLVLLNSDVLPDRPGWLGQLAHIHDRIEDVGAVGPKLLYEDDAVQHAGMYFYSRRVGDRWTNEHYYKGFHREFPLVNESREVPAVTGACLMVEAQLYRDIGGLSGAYVRGDYEDSDFCLRLREKGRRNWYEASVEMYHLEGQSYPSEVRRLASDYNRWLHTETWRDALEALDENGPKDSNAIAIDAQHRRGGEKEFGPPRGTGLGPYETALPGQGT